MDDEDDYVGPAANKRKSAAHARRIATVRMACETCARGKRKCSGEEPCERCARLRISCTYKSADAAARRQSPTGGERVYQPPPPVLRSNAPLLPAGLLGGRAVLSRLSLPQQLFPWQHIRLAASLEATRHDDRRREELLMWLWRQAVFPPPIVSAKAPVSRPLLEHGEPFGSATPRSEEEGGPTDGSGGVAAGAPRDADEGEGGSSSSSSAAGPAAAPISMINQFAATAALFGDNTPTLLAYYNRTTFELERLRVNDAALLLFDWAQEEIDLRVKHGVPVRWLHPGDLVVRCVQEVQYRACLSERFAYRGRYLLRRLNPDVSLEAGGSVARAMLRINEAMRPLREEALRSRRASAASAADALGLGASAAAEPSSSSAATVGLVGPTAASVAAPGLCRSLTPESQRRREEDVFALEVFDSALQYTVFHATEQVSLSFEEGGSTVTQIMRFVDISHESRGQQQQPQLINPLDFPDLCGPEEEGEEGGESDQSPGEAGGGYPSLEEANSSIDPSTQKRGASSSAAAAAAAVAGAGAPRSRGGRAAASATTKRSRAEARQPSAGGAAAVPSAAPYFAEEEGGGGEDDDSGTAAFLLERIRTGGDSSSAGGGEERPSLTQNLKLVAGGANPTMQAPKAGLFYPGGGAAAAAAPMSGFPLAPSGFPPAPSGFPLAPSLQYPGPASRSSPPLNGNPRLQPSPAALARSSPLRPGPAAAPSQEAGNGLAAPASASLPPSGFLSHSAVFRPSGGWLGASAVTTASPTGWAGSGSHLAPASIPSPFPVVPVRMSPTPPWGLGAVAGAPQPPYALQVSHHVVHSSSTA